MFATPVFVSRNVLDPASCASKRASIDLALRHSTASSEASSIDLRRASSTSSNISVSTNASSITSVASVQIEHRSKHRKTLSSNSIFVPQRFQKKLQKTQAQKSLHYNEPLPKPVPVVESAPVVTSSTARISDWQCSDLVVRCKNVVYHVDHAIMCYHSRWFAKVCAVVITPKSSKSVIDLSADDPDAVAAMMQYCYQLDYSGRTSASDITVPEAVILRSHIDVFMLAERYGISGLKRVALQKSEDLIVTVLKLDHNEEQLAQVIREIYASDRRADADDLRHAAVRLCAGHVEAFMHGTEKTMAIVFELMNELPEFRADLFEETAPRRKRRWTSFVSPW